MAKQPLKVVLKWGPRLKRSSNIKWGYIIDPQDPQRIIPVEKLVALAEKTITFYRTGDYSLRDLAAWLTTVSGVPISHVSVKAIVKDFERERLRAYTAGRAAAAAQERSSLWEESRKATESDQGTASGVTAESLPS